jgi:hypothetical protein
MLIMQKVYIVYLDKTQYYCRNNSRLQVHIKSVPVVLVTVELIFCYSVVARYRLITMKVPHFDPNYIISARSTQKTELPTIPLLLRFD